ncbi:uncharacterized protein ACR2FA_003225 [Aphomia sociella]
MWRIGFCFGLILCCLHHVAGNKQDFSQLCKENIQKTLRCNTQLTGPDGELADSDKCKVEYYPSDSAQCRTMTFGPLKSDKPFDSNIGGVSLRPYIMDSHGQRNFNYTVLNITFTNIKWKTMKFRFHDPGRPNSGHCRNIVISNDVTIDDRSVLYYDCYWSYADGNYNGSSHFLDFEASDDSSTNRGQYFFNIPNMQMLSTTVTENEWKPFLYIEILSSELRLHIMPPPPQVRIKGYKVEVKRACIKGSVENCCDQVLKTANVTLKDRNEEMTYDYYFLRSPGAHYFVVTPLHDACTGVESGCQSVASPKIGISTDEHKTLNICIASVTALIVASLFAYYIMLRVIRRYWCRDYRGMYKANEIPPPTKVLAIYPPGNRLHAECVGSFVAYLRYELGIDIMYDGDILNLSHRDPFLWAKETFELASHVMYIVGPADETNFHDNIYEKQIIPAHKNVDILLLNMVKTNRGTRNHKSLSNVYFEHSNGQVPIEMKHCKSFFLLKDWKKMISYLSKDMIPEKQITRTEKGKYFLDDLSRTKKLLSGNRDDVIVRCEKMNSFEKKILV